MANATANAARAQSSCALDPHLDDEDLPWRGHRDASRAPPANLPKFIDVANSFLRYEGASWTVKFALACDRYRFTYARRLDRATFERWTGLSRSTSYRAIEAIEAFVDADGYLQKGIFDTAIGGYVRVLLTDVWEVGILRAMALALLRRWARHPKAVVARSGAVQVVAGELAHALGIHEKTARRILEDLSTGTHRRSPGKRRHLGKLLIKARGGHAPFVIVLSRQAQVDWKAQRAAAAAVKQRVPQAPAPNASKRQADATQALTQQADAAPTPDTGEDSLAFVRGQYGDYLARCRKPSRSR